MYTPNNWGFLPNGLIMDSLISTVTVGLLVIQAITYVFTFALLSISVPTGVVSSHLAAAIISFSELANSSFVEGTLAGTSKSCAEESIENDKQNTTRMVEIFIAISFGDDPK
jgi:hypothetical protein